MFVKGITLVLCYLVAAKISDAILPVPPPPLVSCDHGDPHYSATCSIFGGNPNCPIGFFCKGGPADGALCCPKPQVVKPGNCPPNQRPNVGCAAVIRPEDCRGDQTCPGDKKCCVQGCKKICQSPVY